MTRSPRRFPAPLLSLALALGVVFLVGCGGGTATTSTTAPSVSLAATPSRIAPGGTATLSWTSQNVTSVASSNFGATAVAGSATVGPLNATTDYTITCSGVNGPATAHTTVVVTSSLSVIPSGVLLYSLANTDGSSTLYYQSVAGGSPVSVGTYASGTTVFGTNPTGTRLLLSKPVPGSATNLGLYLTDLDGASNGVQMGTNTFTVVEDASVTDQNVVLAATLPTLTESFTTSGSYLGGGQSGGAVDAAVNASGSEVVECHTGTIDIYPFPSLDGAGTRLRGGGSYNWVRWSPTSALITYTDAGNVWTMATDGTGVTEIATTAGFPTFDSTGTRIYFSKTDGIYVKDLNAGTTSKLASVTGVWSGRIFWH